MAKSDVKAVIVIGDMGPAITEALIAEGFSNVTKGGSSMEQIVQQAAEQASDGDIVLLSPGCASFGMFENYKDRGEKFTQAVKSLA